MILKPETIKKIRAYFDLNIYETKVWLAILSKGIASAGEIAELSGVPRSRTYDVLESLEKKGFVMAKIGKPVKYITVRPKSVIEKLKSNTLKNAKEKIETLSNLKETEEYKTLEELHKTNFDLIKHTKLSGEIRGKSEINSKIREIFENAENQVQICTHASDLINKSRIFSNLFDNLRKRNVEINVALKGTPEEIQKANKKLNIKAKQTNLDAKFFISDNRELLFTISKNNPTEEELGIWLNSEFFTTALSQLFSAAVK